MPEIPTVVEGPYAGGVQYCCTICNYSDLNEGRARLTVGSCAATPCPRRRYIQKLPAMVEQESTPDGEQNESEAAITVEGVEEGDR